MESNPLFLPAHTIQIALADCFVTVLSRPEDAVHLTILLTFDRYLPHEEPPLARSAALDDAF